MANDDLILKIDEALGDSLRTRAEAAGLSVEDYALGVLQRAVEQPGVGENEAPWAGAAVHGWHVEGFRKRDAAYWQDVQRICDETDRDGGVPWEQVEARLRNFGQKR